MDSACGFLMFSNVVLLSCLIHKSHRSLAPGFLVRRSPRPTPEGFKTEAGEWRDEAKAGRVRHGGDETQNPNGARERCGSKEMDKHRDGLCVLFVSEFLPWVGYLMIFII